MPTEPFSVDSIVLPSATSIMVGFESCVRLSKINLDEHIWLEQPESNTNLILELNNVNAMLS